MKVIIYMASTLNGLIARENDDTSFVSAEDWQGFKNIVNKTGNMVIGRRTYDVMKKGQEFSKFGKVKIVVLTRKKTKNSISNVVFTNKKPKEVIKMLYDEGFEEILVAGGSILNTSFMKENLVDEIYIDVMPFAFGKGIKLFAEDDFEAELELIGTKMTSKNEILLHYRVKK